MISQVSFTAVICVIGILGKIQFKLILTIAMKHFVYAVSGAVLFSLIGFPVSSGLSHVFEMKFATSQDSVDSIAMVLILVVIPAFANAGGLLGSSRRLG